MRPDSFMNIAAWMVSATFCENEPSPQSPSESPSPRLSKRSIPTPSRANSLQIRLAAGLSLPRVKPWENTPHPRIGTSGWSTRPASRGPLVLVNHTRSATLPIPSTLIPQLRSVRTEDTQAATSPDEPVQRGRSAAARLCRSAVCETTKEPRQYSRNAHRAAQSVKHLPERLSRRNRNRVVKLFKQLPEPEGQACAGTAHEQTEPELRRSVDGFDRLVLLGQVFALVSMAEDAGFEPARACTQPAFQRDSSPRRSERGFQG